MHASRSVYPLFKNTIKGEFGFNNIQMGALDTGYTLSYSIFLIFSGKIGDYMNRPKFFLFVCNFLLLLLFITISIKERNSNGLFFL